MITPLDLLHANKLEDIKNEFSQFESENNCSLEQFSKHKYLKIYLEKELKTNKIKMKFKI
jgi:hypothetical protein